MGPHVTGLDGGAWLAFGQVLLGRDSRLTDSAYPPAVPVLMALANSFIDALTVARVASMLTLAAVLGAIYVVTSRETSRWLGLGAAALVGTSSVVVEPSAFGGYPQNLALAIMVGAVYLAASYLRGGRRGTVVGLAVALVASALVHHVFFATTGLAVVLIWAMWQLGEPGRVARIRRSLAVGGALALGALAFAPTALWMLAAGYEAPLNTGPPDLESSLRYAFRESQLPWLALIGAAVAWLALRPRRDEDLLPRVAAALMAAALVALLFSAHPRALPPLAAGTTLALAGALHAASKHAPLGRWQHGAILAAAFVPLALWPAGDRMAAEYYDYYRAADNSLVETAAWIDAHDEGGLVVVRADARAWPLGWWFEGLTGARIAVGSDLRWLGYPVEYEAADLASRFFDGGLTADEAVALAAERHVDYLVARKWEWIGWRAWLADPSSEVRIAYDNDSYVVLDVSSHRAVTSPPEAAGEGGAIARSSSN